ncbi:probably inactive leucine-rich repeat receptor-like protein kinase At5g48380 [Populus nigra]|uniref:probably inactive leucine-rich repeat receptor-like protein kinase At5g48380 n=1 Tax=Populus nigra TaxID=3691 RepID=UPI002B26C320|nr:probably inactive leucine-rich repeat receptor-like protein kinase At5g48380 [Populus nigra]
MAVGGAKRALLLIHILSVAGNGYSSVQENNHGSDDHEHRKKLDSSLKSGFLIGYVFSSVSIITIFMSYCVPWARLIKRKGKEVTMKTPMMTSLMERQEMKRKEANVQNSELEKLVTRISFAALNIATRSFDQDNVIGVGKMGTMYRAAHRYDLFTAVKRLHDSQHLEKQFLSELIILGKFRHANIIPLLGFCIESRERLLVYKYMPNGNLHDWLHPVKCNAEKLDWHVRVKIAIGVARGLAWLHDFNNFLIVHLDICSRSILLDKYFVPKISNFGGAMHRRSNDKGLIASSKIGELELIKQDVYQFGILLLELIAVHDPDHNSKSSHTLEENLFERIAHLSSSSSGLFHAVDKSLLGQGFDGEILHFLKIVSSCIHPILDQRPTMLQAFQMLMVLRKRERCIENPKLLAQLTGRR